MRVGRPSDGLSTATLEASTGRALAMIPPCMVAVVGFWWRLAMFTPSTITLFSAGMARLT